MLELLNQMDGFEPTKNIKVIMATNRFGTPFFSHGGIGQSVLAGTRSESRRAGKWVRKASDDVIGNRYGYLHVICQSLSNLYLISINLILSLSLCRSPYHNGCLIFYFTNRYMLSDILDPAFL